jgi:hypothetical protein
MSNGWLEKYSFLSYNPKDFSCRLVLQPLLLAKILVYNAFVIHVLCGFDAANIRKRNNPNKYFGENRKNPKK